MEHKKRKVGCRDAGVLKTKRPRMYTGKHREVGTATKPDREIPGGEEA